MQNNPATKEYFLLGFITLCIVWQAGITIIAILLFFGTRFLKIPAHYLLLLGLMCVLVGWLIYHHQNEQNFFYFLVEGFKYNVIFFKLLKKYGIKLALYFEIKFAWTYMVSFPILLSGLFRLIESLNKSAHASELKQMSKGHFISSGKVNQRRMNYSLKKLSQKEVDGIPLGVSTKTYKPVVVPDYYINQILLVLGTTGSGKTVTLLQFAKHAIRQGYPLIWVDGKPNKDNVNQLWQQATDYSREFFGFNCGNYARYNALCGESYTELKDKIITLKDHWESDYYRTIAEDYLQTTLEVLIKLGKQVDLKIISACLDFENLALLVRESREITLAEKIKSLQHYERQTLTGLQAHLNTLINSELGEYLNSNEDAFDLNSIIENRGVAYFALPALKFPSFAKVLGKLVINDIKSVIEPLEGSQPIFIIFDEFSIFAGEQVLNLVNMGRGKGIHAIFGTQGLSDLKKVDPNFESQLLNCVNTIICHRLNHQECAESITKWIGTEDSFDLTVVVNSAFAQSNLGSLSKNKAFIVHPDDIKKGLETGEAYFISKIDGFKMDKIKILASTLKNL